LTDPLRFGSALSSKAAGTPMKTVLVCFEGVREFAQKPWLNHNPNRI
jgi:hypothetical protein